MKKILLSIILVLFFYTQSPAGSSVWMVQKDKSVIYLGGTLHLLRQSDFPLPPDFSKAYKESDILVFETDLGKFNDPSVQQKLMSKAMYTDGSTIDRHLSARTYNMLKKYCASRGIPISNLRQFKPSLIAIMISTIELSKLGVTQEGVDTFFYRSAIKDGKDIQWLETVEEQIQFIVEMGNENEDAFITYSIQDIESIKQNYTTMVTSWKRGDVGKLNELIVAEIKRRMPKLYKEILTDRNENWLPMIEAYHMTPGKEFILVGAGHLVGPDGILEALRQKGYKVEKLQSE